MSSPYGTEYYAEALPMAVPSKDMYGAYYQGGHTEYSVSPPEFSEHGSNTSGAASYSNPGYSATASYAGSTQGDYDTASSLNGVDFQRVHAGPLRRVLQPHPARQGRSDPGAGVSSEFRVLSSAAFPRHTAAEAVLCAVVLLAPKRPAARSRKRASLVDATFSVFLLLAEHWLMRKTPASSSGLLNNKHRELLELQKQAQARLAKSRARFAEGLKDAREVRADLEWTQKKVS